MTTNTLKNIFPIWTRFFVEIRLCGGVTCFVSKQLLLFRRARQREKVLFLPSIFREYTEETRVSIFFI